MSISMSDQYKKYREQSVYTMTPGELIVLLYEEATLSINKAIFHINKKRICDAHNSIIKTQNIILYLIDSLDMSYPISNSLLSLYEYIYNRLVKANVEKNIEILDEVLKMMVELKSAWQKAEISTRDTTTRSIGKSV